jgi:predicted O-linked N-acetylglucosamine transferase (SPINDLY family)
MFEKMIKRFSKGRQAAHSKNEASPVAPPLNTNNAALQSAEELKKLGDQAIRANNLDQAVLYYQQSLDINPNQANAYNNQGIALYYLKRLDEALASYDRALALNPDHAEAYNNQGLALRDLKRPEQAISSFNRAIALKPEYAEAYNNLGLALDELSRSDQALISYDRAIALNPDYISGLNIRGIAFYEKRKLDEALASFNRAIDHNPNYAEAYNNRGLTLHELNRLGDALISYDRAIALKSDYANAYHNRGVALNSLKRLDEAIASYDCAIALNPDYADTHNNRAVVLHGLKRFDEALISYERALALNPDFECLNSIRLFIKLTLCNWDNIDNQVAQLSHEIRNGEKSAHPFPMLALTNDRTILKKSAEIFAQTKFPMAPASNTFAKIPKHDKICVAYFSPDFRQHAVSTLTAELFELHDRSQFEIIAFSFGPNTKDDMRLRLETTFDQFIDVHDRSDQDIVTLARNLGVDIAIDLGGYTNDCRPGIFALRAAPLQVNYLGYPGTMGAEFMDYIIADPTIIPPEHQPDYTEKVIYLPSFQVNDSKRQIADKQFTREELGLPPTGFVFCCFNNNYKINPQNFDSWMRILQQVEGSVLWLFAGSETFITNLTKEAKLRGVDPERLVFAKRLSAPEYLARYRVADLFLDTLPYNAGTTASDALWAGLPVLTLIGETFAGRMAASLLNAIHLPELVTTSQDEYEAMAVRLATHPDELMNIKQKLADNRLTTPLFDTPQFTRNLEAAYTQIYERYHADLAPDHIYVQ